jgi:hypothetical protein
MDALKQAWEAIVERFRNPILFAFAATWAIANYKLLVVLASSAPFLEKITYIDTVLYPPSESHVSRLVLIPVAGAIIYVFVFPAISLLSTWATSNYERLHSGIKITALRKATLTVEQRDTLEREVSALVNKVQKEAQDAKAARLDAARSTQENVTKLFVSVQKAVLEGLKASAASWPKDCVKPPPNRTVGGSPEQEAFVIAHGIPPLWAKVVREMHDGKPVNAEEVSKRLSIPVVESMDALLGLSALAILTFTWIDDGPFFMVGGGSWGALLSGRPA